jgi:thiol-disulfide isomerase/thioredoxin
LQIKKLILFLSIVCVFLSFLYGSAVTEINPNYKPERFPDLTFENTLSKDEQAYLGISRKKYFSFKEIKVSLIIVELTSIYCVSCKKNIPILNEFYQRIQKDLELKDKVKVIGIAIGNNIKEVESLRNEYKVLYPLLTHQLHKKT